MRPRDIAARELERLELKHNGNTSAMARDLFSEYPGLFKSVLATRSILRRVKEKTPVYHQITPERESRVNCPPTLKRWDGFYAPFYKKKTSISLAGILVFNIVYILFKDILIIVSHYRHRANT